MASTEDIALASVIVAGTVGIVTPTISVTAAALQQRRTLKHERGRLALAELRQVIDGALQAARTTRTSLRYHPGAGLPPKLQEHGEAVGFAASRLSVRLGSAHSVTAAYDQVQAALGEWTTGWLDVPQLLEAVDDEEISAHFEALEDAFHERLEKFESAALGLVGFPNRIVRPPRSRRRGRQPRRGSARPLSPAMRR